MDRLMQRAQQPLALQTTYYYLKRPEDVKDPGLAAGILSIDLETLPDITREALGGLEDYGSREGASPHWLEFKWRLLAFTSLPDAFDARLSEMEEDSSIFQLWYFYYESKYLLTEAFLCGLTGYNGALKALLRPILEFSVIQNYFRRSVEKTNSYKKVEDYFKNGRLPSWHRLAMDSVPPTKLGALVRYRVQTHLSGLSSSSSHAYAPRHSPKGLGSLKPEQTLEGLWDWYSLSIVLDCVLWLYYVNFPCVFHPCDLMRRFGCNPPVGLVVDNQLAAIVRRTLKPADYGEFLKDSEASGADLRAFIESRPFLSDEDILSSWNPNKQPCPTTPEEAFCSIMAELRATKELLAWGQPSEEKDVGPSMAIDSLSWWRKVQGRKSR
jgi:hypothetical protein